MTRAKESRSKCRMMTDAQLKVITDTFPAEIQRAQSLLAAARREAESRAKRRSTP